MKAIAVALFALLAGTTYAEQPFTLNVMAPLVVGNMYNPYDPATTDAWNEFGNQLQWAKEQGANAVSVDMWTGLVNPAKGVYRYDIYRKEIDYLRHAHLKLAAILSNHRLGGNVGDGSVFQPVPNYYWTEYIGKHPLITDQYSLMWRSEQGNYNGEAPSPWALPWLESDIRANMIAFRDFIANDVDLLDEINISLGPAGELRNPSYNPHDFNSGYGFRGALQTYSPLAIRSFQEYCRSHFGTIEELNAYWGTNLARFEDILPPSSYTLNTDFFSGWHVSNYGRTFFSWNNESLVAYGERVLTIALEVLDAPGAPTRGVPLAAKLAGVYWYAGSSRLAELMAGLIPANPAAWDSPEQGHGYANILNMFKRIQMKHSRHAFRLHMTAIEMDDHRDGPEIASRAKSLVNWIGDYAKRIDLPLRGENALGYELAGPRAWQNMNEAIDSGLYSGVTLLRLGEPLQNDIAKAGFRQLADKFHTMNCSRIADGGLFIPQGHATPNSLAH